MLKDHIFDYNDKNNAQIIYLQQLSKTTNTLYNVIIAALILLIAALPFIKVDLFTTTPAIIDSKMLRESITAPFSGKIALLKVVNNEYIKRGDVIVELSDEATTNELNANKERQRIVLQYIHDLTMLNSWAQTKAQPILYTPQYQTQYSNLLQQRHEKTAVFENAVQMYNRYTSLFKDKVISASEFEQHALAYKEAEAKLNLIESQNNTLWQSEQYQYNQELHTLNIREKQLLEICKNSKIISNVSGIGYKEDGIHEGAFVQGGQKIAQVYPNNNLIAVCYVSPKDIAYIKMHQKIRLQIDAYNYYEWGMITGKVFEISKEIDMVNNAPIYIIKCTIDTPYLYLHSGSKGAIIKGMTGRANFYLSTRTLWQLLFTKINDWFDPKKNS